MNKKRLLSILLILIFSFSVCLSLAFPSFAEDEEQNQNANEPSESPEQSYTPKMSITLDSNFVVNIYIPAKNTLKFTFDGETKENLTEYAEEIYTISGEEYYKVTKELPASSAAEELTLNVSALFGESEAEGTFTFSIPKYSKAVLRESESAAEKALIKDALLYIASAYTYFEKENAEEVCATITEIIGNHKISNAISSMDSDENPGLIGAAFVLGARPGVKFYLPADADIDSYEFYAAGKKAEKVYEGEDENGRFVLVSLFVYRMCGDISYTTHGEKMGSYSISNYYSYVSKTAYTDENKEALRDLLRKFYNYSLSAGEYYIEYNTENEAPESVDLSEYRIVYPKGADTSLKKKAEKIASLIEDMSGVKVEIGTDKKASFKNLYIGHSSYIPTKVAVKLASCASEDAFIIDFDSECISVFGKTDASTLRAAEYFVEKYICPNGSSEIPLTEQTASIIKIFIKLENGSEIIVEEKSTVFGVKGGVYQGGLYPSKLSKSYYPSIIELKHNGENNGKLLAILAVNDTPSEGYEHLDTNACVMESSDGGKTWTMIARPMETINPTYEAEDGTIYNIQGISMAHIYELPERVGDMPAGTILYSGTSVNYDCYSQVAVWRSFDCGYTWEEYTIVDSAGGLREGVWEPFMWYEESDGYLYCFYSDDSDPAHDQKLVFKRSSDGVNWSDAVEVCSFKKQKDRPGMIIMTKMANGEYLIVYEYYGSYSGNIFYKTTKDITSWNPASPGTMLSADGYSVTGAPSCIWTSSGGENGILIISGKADSDGGQQHHLFVSLDYGKTFSTIENPLSYDITLDVKETNRVGHSASFIVSSDPSLIYYVNTTVTPETGYQRVEFAALRIYGDAAEETEEESSPSSFVKARYESSSTSGINYWLYTPENATENMPLIVYLHGGSGKGDDLELITAVDGLPQYLRDGIIHPNAYVIIPQVSSEYRGWGDIKSELIKLINNVKSEYKIDSERVSLTGHSMGGTGTWQLALFYPETFSAIAPLSGSVTLSQTNLDKLKNIHIWAVVGTEDTVVSPESSIAFIESIAALNPNAKITELDGVDHFGVPSAVYLSNEFDIINWLISKTR